MSHLRITLLVVGVVLVIGVYAFNVWQERQFRKRAERAFAHEHDDVLLKSSARVEPKLNAGSAPSVKKEPAFTSTATSNAGIATIDVAIDYVVEIALNTPADGVDLYATLRALAVQWRKPVIAEGSTSSAWQPLSAGQTHRRLRYAVQLVNRDGSVTPEQLQVFRDAAQTWAAHHDGRMIAAEVAEAQQVAVRLDRLCGDVDIALGVNVVSDGELFTGEAIAAAAENAGLQLEADGKFHLRDEVGIDLFTLENHEPALFDADELAGLRTSGMTLLLDVPRVADSAQAFERMHEIAQQLATALNGTLADDNRVPLSAVAITRIRQQLQGIADKMRAAGIVAGTTRAQRLFS